MGHGLRLGLGGLDYVTERWCMLPTVPNTNVRIIGVGTYRRGTARAKSGTAQIGLSRPTFWQ